MSNMSKTARRRRFWGVGCLTAVAAGSVLALNAGGTVAADPQLKPYQQESPALAVRVPYVEAAQKDAFAVLARPQHDGEAIDTTQAGPFGTNLQLARSVDTSEGDVYVLPGNDVVCLRAEDDAGDGYACGPTDLVEDGVLMIAMHDQDEGAVTVYGLVPDDAGDVELTTPDGTETLDVTDNVFSAELDSSVGASVQTEGTTGTYPVP